MTALKLRAPIVLVHGLFGFDQIKLCGWTIAAYFRGIPEYLAAAGNRVVTTALHPTHGVAWRAAQLKAQLDRDLPGEAVHLIAHSMGGLDARYMISCLGMADRVLTLTTLGTPHRGTAFADWGIRRLERVLKPAFDFCRVPANAFYDLTTQTCEAFNARVPDAPNVRYFSIAGRLQSKQFGPQWRLIHQIVHAAEGDNDGVVSVASARYGEHTDLWEADHMSLVNWPPNPLRCVTLPGDRLRDYGTLIGRLRDAGF